MPLINNETAPKRNNQNQSSTQTTTESSTNHQPNNISSTEQLHQMTAQREMSLENILLKKSLTEYSEAYEKLQKGLINTLLLAEQNFEKERKKNEHQLSELSKNVKEVKTASEQLKESMNKEITALTSSVKDETVKTVRQELKNNLEQMKKATETVENYEKKIIKKMNDKLFEFDQSKQKFFEFDSIRSFIFWSSQVAILVMLALLIKFIFFNK